jgi:para-nitrobenzyl esterase
MKHNRWLISLILALSCFSFFGGCSSSSDADHALTQTGSESNQDATTYDPLVRKTAYGYVKGIETNYGTWAWLGMPYAKPPVGDLRWRAPQDSESWKGIRDARHFCSYCVQYGNYLSETGVETLGELPGEGVPVGSEDCLYLNIWRPRSHEKKLPVYVFIHGGANITGRSDLSIYDGAHFAARSNMVFVTINYRLGEFGWFWYPALCEGKDPRDDSGNYGTLDIIKALTWIRNNIAAFDGDPQNVTITGQSAGGFNVYSMLASPLAAGLFHKAIVHSGFSQSCSLASAQQKAQDMLDRLLIQDGYAQDAHTAEQFLQDQQAQLGEEQYKQWIRQYLRSKTIPEIYAPQNSVPMAASQYDALSSDASMGIYEDGYVIPASPLECLRTGNYNRVPLLIGCTMEELKLFVPLALFPPRKFWESMESFNPNHPDYNLAQVLDPTDWPQMFILYALLPPLGQLVFQTNGTDTMAPAAKKYQDAVYVYKFLWDEEPEPFDYLIGAAHAMDLPFFFGNFITDKSSLTSFAWSDANRASREPLSNAMMTYVAQFARTGDPNGADTDLPLWSPWSDKQGTPKRMLFDAGKLAMSSERIEPEQFPCPQCVMEDIFNLIMGTTGRSRALLYW